MFLRKWKKSGRNKLVKDDLSQKFSQHDLSYKYKISLSYVNKILQEFSVKCYKKEKIVHVSKEQLDVCINCKLNVNLTNDYLFG